MNHRISPSASSRSWTRLAPTSDASAGRPAPQTAAALVSPQPPANTARRANVACSAAASSRWLQSIVERSVRWREGRSRAPSTASSSEPDTEASSSAGA